MAAFGGLAQQLAALRPLNNATAATMIPDETISEIRERTDIIAVVQEYVPLKRVGASFKGLCPFHAEKTPSFYVHPGRQFFHCFGCQTSGDVLSFVMKLEGKPFPEVVRELADRAGVELPELDRKQEDAYRRARAREERLVALTEAAAGFFVKQMAENPLGQMARDEFERRGIRAETAEAFRLGYAPHGWDGLATWLAEHGWSPAEAEEVGLIVPRRNGRGHYDRFRHRLMFPIADVNGRIVAFSGRMLDPPPDEPLSDRGEGGAKYVNSPEGPLYKKGEVLFGLHEGRVNVRREGWVLLCEGNFDLLALHQAGFENAVAPMGTALTSKQTHLLKRFCARVVLLFDGDKAGRKAVRAAAGLLLEEGFSASVVSLPPGADPDSFLREKGSESLETLVEEAPSLLRFVIDDAAEWAGGDPSRRAEAIEGLAPILRHVGNRVEAQIYIEHIARRFEVHDPGAVRAQLRQGLRRTRRSGPERGGRDVPPRRVEQDRMDQMRPDRGRPGLEESSPTPPVRLQIKPGTIPHIEAHLIGVFLDNPELWSSQEAKILEDLLTTPDLRAIFHSAARMVESRGGIDAPALVGEFGTSPWCSWLEDRLAIQEYDANGAAQAIKDGLKKLHRRRIEDDLERLKREIAAAFRGGDRDRALELSKERNQLFASARTLMQAKR